LNLLAGLTLIALSALPPASSAYQGLVDHRRTATRVFHELLNGEKYALFAELYDPAFVKHIDGHQETLGEEIEDAKSMRTAFSDLVFTIDAMVAEGDTVAIRYTARGTHDGPFADIPATGRKVTAFGVTLYRFAGSRIVEEWTTYNMLDILGKLGVSVGPRVDCAPPAASK